MSRDDLKMTLWKVRVECFRKGDAYPFVRRFIVGAADSAEASTKGHALAERATVVGFNWAEIKVREAVCVTVPLEI